MPYIARDCTGRINALFYQPVEGFTEFVPVSHPEVLGFVAGSDKKERDLERIVSELIGVVEDLAGALLSKNALSITDLSPAARKYVRPGKLQGEALCALLSDDGDVCLP
ncbi:MAG: hypothetical protein HYZ17_11505 [Betaproteobacteria bacterium]|nr:hypothetical protein [Betaproteobacteria bacterium]